MSKHENPSDEALRTLLSSARTIAVVGASDNPDKPSHGVTKRLIAAGYRVFPVNPGETEVLGQRAYPSLDRVPEPIDIVNVFRRPEHTPKVAEEAVGVGAKALWLQLGISNAEAEATARRGGLTVVSDTCIAVVIARLAITRA